MTTPAKIIWITGASSGIGEAVAKELARRGCIIAASARSADKLRALERQQFGSGRIVAYPLDVTDSDAQQQTIERIYRDLGRIDCAILNAGTFFADDDFPSPENIRKNFMLNVFSPMDAVNHLAPKMRQQTNAQIAIVSSVAGYRGLPRAVAYSGTKAALIAMAESLKFICDPLGIKLQLICPGFVKTPLTDHNDFPMPFLISAERAATIIADGLDSNRFEIVFPWQMAVMMKLLRIMPNALYFWLLKRQTGVGKS